MLPPGPQEAPHLKEIDDFRQIPSLTHCISTVRDAAALGLLQVGLTNAFMAH